MMKQYKESRVVYEELKPVYAITIIDKLLQSQLGESPIMSLSLRDNRTYE